jgi:DNA-binding MarR family transcriptional regulator
MGKGIGTTQRDILAAVPPADRCTTRDLADQLHRSQRQIARAVRSLEQRGLVEIHWEGTTYPMFVTKKR